MVHKNETTEERRRRLKGKATIQEEPPANSPTPQTMLTRDIGTVVFRKERTHLTPIAPWFVSSPLRLRDEPEEPCLDLVTLMKSSHIDDMVLTREEEAEVDKLAEEFGDAVMDDTMVQNDDLLVDEPGYDAEIIAISQLSLENDVNNDNSVTSEAAKAPQPTKTQQTKNKSVVLSRTLPIGTSQGKMGGAKEKKKTIQSMELKGAQASKKLNALRGRPSPRKRGSGNLRKSNSHAVPRHEVFTSAKSTMSFVSGSVGSQKPPSKKI